MARVLTPTDACTIMTALYQQATGRANVTAVNLSTFVSAGETVLATGVENTLNALSLVIGKTLVGVKVYDGKYKLIQEVNTGKFANRMRRISFYDKGPKEAGFVNTDKHNRNLYNGYDNTSQGSSVNSSVGTMWEQDKPIPVEINFGGSLVWDFCLTVYPDQMKAAFRDPEEFIVFWDGLMTQKANEIELIKEEFNRATVLNMIAGTIAGSAAMPGAVCNLTTEFNKKYGTNYTSAQLRSTYLKEFAQFLAFKIPQASRYLSEATVKYHWNPSVTRDGVTYNKITRHCPKADQKLFFNADIIDLTKATVYPALFNPQYLDIKNAEFVDSWQGIDANDAGGIAMSDEDARRQISVIAAIPDFAGTNSGAQTYTDTVNADVLGVLFDKDACMSQFIFESADTTPLEARKRYRNTWYHNQKNSINDFTYGRIVFIMDDSAVTQAESPAAEGGNGGGSGFVG